MADQDSAQFNVNIGTTADTSGAEAAVDALKKVEQEAAAANAASGGGPSGQPGETVGIDQGNMQSILEGEADARQAIETSAAETSAADAESLAAEERKSSLLAQRQILADLSLEALQAEAAGQGELAIALQSEIEIRTTALGLQQRALLSEEEAMGQARSRAAAEAQITAQKEAQAALNAELVAQEEAQLAAEEAKSKVYGRGGQVGNALKNFGVDSGLATTMGIAVLAGVELNRQINEMAKSYDEARLTAEKQSAEFEKQIDQWKTMASLAENMGDAVKVTDSVNKGMEALLEKFRDVKGEGSGGFLQNMTDGLKGWANALNEAYHQVAANDGTISKSTQARLDQENHLKTSTEEGQAAIEEQMDAAQKAGQVFEDYAKKQATWFDSIKALPVADQLSALIEKEGELITKQQGIKEGTRAYNDLQKQLEEVAKAEDKVIAAQSKDAESIGKLDEQIKKLTEDRAKLVAEQPKPGSQNDFVKVDNETIGGQKSSGYYHPSDTTTNAAGNTISKSGAAPISPDDPALKAFLEMNQKLSDIDAKLGDAKEKRQTAQDHMTGAPRPDATTPDSMTNRATPDGDEADFQSVLDKRAQDEHVPENADWPAQPAQPAPPNTGTPANYPADPALPGLPAVAPIPVAPSADAVKDATTQDATATKAALDAAAQNIDQLPDHFAAFKTAIDLGTQTTATNATAATQSLTDYTAAVNVGFTNIGDTMGTALKDLQLQINTTNQQLQSYIDSQNA